MINFIFTLSWPFLTYFGLKCSHNGIVLYFGFFFYFFEILYFESGRNETELLFSHILGFFQPIWAQNEAIMVSFSFLNFFSIFF